MINIDNNTNEITINLFDQLRQSMKAKGTMGAQRLNEIAAQKNLSSFQERHAIMAKITQPNKQ